MVQEFMVKPTEEMIEFYRKRTQDHIDIVHTKMLLLSAEYNIPYLNERIGSHDFSKYSDDELTPYIWLTEYYRCKQKGLPFTYPEGIEQKVTKAIEHHYAYNRHHPESYECVEMMQEVDLAEMVCDLCAMSDELNNGKGSEYFRKNHCKKWNFTQDQITTCVMYFNYLENRNE